MRVKELIKLLQDLENQNAEIRMEDNIHNLIPIWAVIDPKIVHDYQDGYVITQYEYNT